MLASAVKLAPADMKSWVIWAAEPENPDPGLNDVAEEREAERLGRVSGRLGRSCATVADIVSEFSWQHRDVFLMPERPLCEQGSS